jgi:glycosyltransferase involved in cell wall biosynthesis
MSKDRVTVFTKLFPPEGGGAELATYLIAKNVLSEHFEVTVISGTAKPRNDILRHSKYIHWPMLEERFKPLEWIKIFTNSSVIRHLIEQSDIIYIASHSVIPLAIVAKRTNPDARIIIHMHNYQPISYNSIILHDFPNDLASQIMFEIYDHHSVPKAVAAGFLAPINHINELALMQAERVLFVSRRQMEIFGTYLPWIEAKAAMIYNLLPEIEHIGKRPSDTPILLYMGGGSLVRGFHLVLKAGSNLKKDLRSPRIAMTNVLPAYARNMLERVDRKREVFELLGRVDRGQILKLLSEARSVLFTSIWEEPLPYVVMESMMSGTIPVASAIGGVPEMVENTLAEDWLFEPDNANQLLSRIQSVLALSKEELIDLSHRLREQTLKKFDSEPTRKALLENFSS